MFLGNLRQGKKSCIFVTQTTKEQKYNKKTKKKTAKGKKK